MHFIKCCLLNGWFLRFSGISTDFARVLTEDEDTLSCNDQKHVPAFPKTILKVMLLDISVEYNGKAAPVDCYTSRGLNVPARD